MGTGGWRIRAGGQKRLLRGGDIWLDLKDKRGLVRWTGGRFRASPTACYARKCALSVAAWNLSIRTAHRHSWIPAKRTRVWNQPLVQLWRLCRAAESSCLSSVTMLTPRQCRRRTIKGELEILHVQRRLHRTVWPESCPGGPLILWRRCAYCSDSGQPWNWASFLAVVEVICTGHLSKRSPAETPSGAFQ